MVNIVDLFKNYQLNIKCVIFSGVNSLFYYSMGGRNLLVFLLIFVLSYIAMGWYDYMYQCKPDFAVNVLSVTGAMKPEKSKLSVFLFHAILIMPLLMYVGYYGADANKRVFPFILGISSIGMVYHSLMAYKTLDL